jgi:tRNA-dihydrouridine synthase
VAEKSPLPIVGNGDINDVDFALKCLEDYPVHGIMIGRGALKNPFIFRDILEKLEPETTRFNSDRDYTKLIKFQYELIQKAYSEERSGLVVILLRKFLAWYSAGFSNSSKFRKKLYEMKNPDDIFRNSLDYFQSVNLDERDDLSDFLMGGHG